MTQKVRFNKVLNPKKKKNIDSLEFVRTSEGELKGSNKLQKESLDMRPVL